MRLNVYSLAYPVRSLGPGPRAVVWTTGCGRGCPGCVSPEMQGSAAGRPVRTDTLARRLETVDLPLDGLTVSGGEPLDQAEALGDLLRRVRRVRPEWDVSVYSGYMLEEILAGSRAAREVLELIDVLIDGPFEIRRPSRHPLAGSGNQKVHCLSARARENRAAWNRAPEARFDLALGPADFAMLVGVGDPEARARATEALHAAGRRVPESGC